jgi:hypothetical protein
VARVAPPNKSNPLCQLNDDVLIKIIQYLDHKSKLQLMATCKRFESLIGNNSVFYKNFRVRFERYPEFYRNYHHHNSDFESDSEENESNESEEEVEYEIEKWSSRYDSFRRARRNFGQVVFKQLDFYYGLCPDPKVLLKLFDRIGANLTSIKMESVGLSDQLFQLLMMKTRNLTNLEMVKCQFRSCNSADLGQKYDENCSFKCEKLKFLLLKSVDDCDVVSTIVPNSLDQLIMCNEESIPILNQQQGLKSLSLSNYHVSDFAYKTSNCNLTEIHLKRLSFKTSKDFQRFSKFLKMQEDLQIFQLDQRDQNDLRFGDFLTTTLRFGSLRKFKFYCNPGILTTLSTKRICNPHLETLTLIIDPRDGEIDFKGLAAMFPNVNFLKIEFDVKDFSFNLRLHDNYDLLLDVDIQGIHYFKNTKRLLMNFIDGKFLGQIEMDQLREFIVEEVVETNYWIYEDRFDSDEEFDELLSELEYWKLFIGKHTHLEKLEVKAQKYFGIDFFETILDGLPILTTFKFRLRVTKENVHKAVALIGKYYSNWIHLKLALSFQHKDLINVVLLENFADARTNFDRFGTTLYIVKGSFLSEPIDW